MNKNNKKRMSQISTKLNDLHEELINRMMKSQIERYRNFKEIIEEVQVLRAEYRDLESKNAS